jgi:hypothetical protein
MTVHCASILPYSNNVESGSCDAGGEHADAVVLQVHTHSSTSLLQHLHLQLYALHIALHQHNIEATSKDCPAPMFLQAAAAASSTLQQLTPT